MTTPKKDESPPGGNRERGEKSLTKHNDTIQSVAIDSISSSPENDDVYGKIDTENHELVMLCNDIIEHGIREPIQVSVEGYIVSGHRRYAAARLAGLEKVPIRRLVISRADHSSISWKRVLASHNRQRVKSAAVRMKESLLAIDPDVAYQQMIALRQERDRDAPNEICIRAESSRAEISQAKEPMLLAAISAINELKKYWPLTVRQVHYRLLNKPPLRHASKPDSRYSKSTSCESGSVASDHRRNTPSFRNELLRGLRRIHRSRDKVVSRWLPTQSNAIATGSYRNDRREIDSSGNRQTNRG